MTSQEWDAVTQAVTGVVHFIGTQEMAMLCEQLRPDLKGPLHIININEVTINFNFSSRNIVCVSHFIFTRGMGRLFVSAIHFGLWKQVCFQEGREGRCRI